MTARLLNTELTGDKKKYAELFAANIEYFRRVPPGSLALLAVDPALFAVAMCPPEGAEGLIEDTIDILSEEERERLRAALRGARDTLGGYREQVVLVLEVRDISRDWAGDNLVQMAVMSCVSTPAKAVASC